jgi:predicted nuclease of restriction endonuclease-like RecB superfamily
MAFKTSDFKKTTRGTGTGRVIYPHQIRDGRYTASIGYAIAYFERMVGQRRAEFETDALLEFFGDPKLARGLVACLADTYRWVTPTFEESVGEEAARTLHRAGVERAADLRARLYLMANARYGGFLAPDRRRQALRELCEAIEADAGVMPADPQGHLVPKQLEQILILDSEDQQILVKRGAQPEPDQIVARYNYNSLETALFQAESIELQLEGAVWTLLSSAHNLARRYRIGYTVGARPNSLFDTRLDLTLLGQKDALGNWGRAGRRLVRAFLRLLAAHPGSIQSGEVLVHIGGRPSTLRLDGRVLQILGATPSNETEIAWDNSQLDLLQRTWGRALVAGRTAGWRLRRDPEPLVGGSTLVAPDFSLRRGRQTLAVCLATGRASAESLNLRLKRLGRGATAVVLVQELAASALKGCPVPVVMYVDQPSEALPGIVAAVERHWPRGWSAHATTPWQTLEQQVDIDGFVDEAAVAKILGCEPREAVTLVRRWGGTRLHALQGLGVCDGDTLDEIRQMLERAA